MTIGHYVTSETVRLGLSGISAGLAAGLVWRAVGRTRWGAAPFVVAVLAAATLTGRFDRPRWSSMVASGGIVMVAAGIGAARSLAGPGTRWTWVAAAALVSAAGVWAAVPETGPALLVGGGLVGLVAVGALTGTRWTPSAGVGVAAVLGWAALSGAADRPWAALGGTLCTGLAPWFALRPLFSARRPNPGPRPWLLGAHVAVVALAARWIAVDPHAGWARVAALAAAGGLMAVASRPRA